MATPTASNPPQGHPSLCSQQIPWAPPSRCSQNPAISHFHPCSPSSVQAAIICLHTAVAILNTALGGPFKNVNQISGYTSAQNTTISHPIQRNRHNPNESLGDLVSGHSPWGFPSSQAGLSTVPPSNRAGTALLSTSCTLGSLPRRLLPPRPHPSHCGSSLTSFCSKGPYSGRLTPVTVQSANSPHPPTSLTYFSPCSITTGQLYLTFPLTVPTKM